MKGLHRILVAGLIGLTFGTTALADGWGQFYVSKTPRAARAGTPIASGGEDGVCIREILAAQARHGIPDNMLLAIGLQEAGTRRNGQFTVWPYAVNAEGEGRLFDSRLAALDWIAERQRAGVRSIDVGCMQINMRWHPDAFVNAAEGFDPTVNVDYAARFLKQLYAQTGNWMQAAVLSFARAAVPRHLFVALAQQYRCRQCTAAGIYRPCWRVRPPPHSPARPA